MAYPRYPPEISTVHMVSMYKYIYIYVYVYIYIYIYVYIYVHIYIYINPEIERIEYKHVNHILSTPG